MKKVTKAVVALMLTVAVVLFTTGCKKDYAEGDGTISGHTYVDLDLPSGTLWAACNVGANTPESYGDYFAWGETKPKNSYSWSTYKYANGTSWKDPQLTKYCNNSSYGYNGFIDNLTALLPGDDATTANWGSGWRMPTRAEWQELLDNTTSVSTTQNGVIGVLFTAANGNSLFLPAAGYRGGKSETSLDLVGEEGYYLSSSLRVDRPEYIWSLDIFDHYISYSARDLGHSIRPVHSAQ